MPNDLISELPELIDWLHDTIEPIQGWQWRIELNSKGGGIVEAKASVVESATSKPGQSMTISRVTMLKFRLGQQKKVFSTD